MHISYDVIPFISKYLYFKKAWSGHFWYHQNCSKMQFIFVFLDIKNFVDFQWRNADISRTPGVCHVIQILFGSSLDKVYLPSFIIVGYVWQISRSGVFFAPVHPREAPQMSIPNRIKDIGHKFQPYACNSCHYLSMMVYDLDDFIIINIKGVDCKCFVCDISKTQESNC